MLAFYAKYRMIVFVFKNPFKIYKTSKLLLFYKIVPDQVSNLPQFQSLVL